MTPELLPDGRLDIARTSWGDYLSPPAPTFDSLERESGSNEAAERLRRLVAEHPMYEGDLDEALRTERRMVVDEILARLRDGAPTRELGDYTNTLTLLAIFDEIGGGR